MHLETPAPFDLIIIGAGPAGCAAAIRAAQLRPERASRVLLLDGARFPRVKVCGGGIVRRGDYLLRRLGVDLHVHSTPIDAGTFVFPSGTVTLRRPGMFRVVRREEFDDALLHFAQARGVQVRQGTPVLDLQLSPEGVLVSTPQERFRATVVIGADGANGLTRKVAISGRPRLSMVGLETFTRPTLPELTPRQRRTAVFDFTCVGAGIQGYAWDFPAGEEQSPLVNRGVFHTHFGGRPSRMNLKSYLLGSLHERNIEVAPEQIKGHPAHMYDPSVPCSAPHLLLAGDAIGIEPLLGEGISSALETGIMAAETAVRALRSGDYSFSRYSDDVRASHRMRSVRLKRAVAERFYTGQPRWWALVGTVGVTAAYLRASQSWDGLRGMTGVGSVSAQQQHRDNAG